MLLQVAGSPPSSQLGNSRLCVCVAPLPHASAGYPGLPCLVLQVDTRRRDRWAVCLFYFSWFGATVFRSGCPSGSARGPFLHGLPGTGDLSTFHDGRPNRCGVVSHCGFGCVSLMTAVLSVFRVPVGHLCVLWGADVCSGPLPPFSAGHFIISLLLSCMSSLYVFGH